jgi:hypothetical protein
MKKKDVIRYLNRRRGSGEVVEEDSFDLSSLEIKNPLEEKKTFKKRS